MDNRVSKEISVRRIRVVKHRGPNHGTNEYHCVMDQAGLSVIPITSAGLDQPVKRKRVSTGVPSWDRMFVGCGYSRCSTVLASGTAGTEKTSLASAFARVTCQRGERCLFLSYEESAGQLIQNMGLIDMRLEPWIQKNRLRVTSTRPSFFGLEKHLFDLHKTIAESKPAAVFIDSLWSLLAEGRPRELQSMITRMIDILKSEGITGFLPAWWHRKRGTAPAATSGCRP